MSTAKTVPVFCQPPGRNYVLPNGKIAAAFFDFDGTIAECEPDFVRAKDMFWHFMRRLGFNKKDAAEVFAKIEHDNMNLKGFEVDMLGEAMAATYRALCKKHGKRVNSNDELICREIGRHPYWRKPKEFKDALPVLNRTQHNFLMVLVTIGNREAQKYKAKMLGLQFDEMIITAESNKRLLVANAIKDCNIDPRYSFMKGNSAKSDGDVGHVTNMIYNPLETGLKFDEAELPTQTDFEIFVVKNWREAEEQGIMRLVRRRRYLLGDQHTYKESSEDDVSSRIEFNSLAE